MEKPVRAKTFGKIQQKLAMIAATIEPAANTVGFVDLIDGGSPESELLMPEFASRIAWRNTSRDGNPSLRPSTE
jgi:hypothetical protein